MPAKIYVSVQYSGLNAGTKQAHLGSSVGRAPDYCSFDSFQEVVFCLVPYTKELNLQIFVMI